MAPLFFRIHACYNAPIGADWREQLIDLLGAKPRRLSRWCELGLFGALACIQRTAPRQLADTVALRVYSEYGAFNATCLALEQTRDYLPMPFTFMQTQPGQLFNALGSATGWHGDGYTSVYPDRHLGEVSLLRSLRQPSLLGWVDDNAELISRWIWLEQTSGAEIGANNRECDWHASSSIFCTPDSARWLKIDATQQVFTASQVAS